MDENTHLRHWTPRPPSAKIGARLFGREEVVIGRWALPAAACAAAVLIVLSFASDSLKPAGTGLFATLNPGPVANLSSNADFTMTKLDRNLEWNVWIKATFDWTNRGVSPSSIGSFQVARTNILMR